MRLRKLSIKDFLSISGTINLDIDPSATVLLGANDHGRSNILKALCCLNDDTPIGRDQVNWDCSSEPCISFEFALDDEERDLFLKKIPSRLGLTAAIVTADGEMVNSVRINEDEITETPDSDAPTDDATAEEVQSRMHLLHRRIAKSGTFIVQRVGAGAPLRVMGIPLASLPKDVLGIVRTHLPRVELFQASSGELQDAVQADQIKTPPFEFLQGVFYYAGLDPLSMDGLFQQDDSTERALDEASERLDKELRSIWAQGRDLDLHFELRHRQNRIEFLANDPAVKNRKARMSKRSAGVTQFFRLSMTLHARRKKHPSNAYIYLFDEPGVFLHPQGQRDLIQVFEQLTSEAQLVYATHSLFMLNQNFPERHRLIVRNSAGTTVDQKPYRANWRLATDALGVHLTANILFSSAVLLVEGDSDPFYLYELFRRLNHAKLIDADANMLGILSYSDVSNLRFLLQQFKRENAPCQVLVLADGDKAGRKILDATKELCKRLDVRQVRLDDGKSIEDLVLDSPILLDAAEETIRGALEAEKKPIPENLRTEINEKWEAHRLNPEKTTGRWFQEIAKSIVKSEVSKVALARNYVFRCRDQDLPPVNGEGASRQLELCRKIIEELGLPGLRASKEMVAS